MIRMLIMMKRHQEDSYKVHSTELKIYLVSLFVIAFLKVGRWLMRSNDYSCLIEESNNPASSSRQWCETFYKFIIWEDVYNIENFLALFVFIHFKKNKDYISEFSNLRNLTMVSIHQRRIREDGSYDKGLSEERY